MERAKLNNSDAKDPGNLLIYEKGENIHGYKKTAIDDILKGIGRGLGFDFSNHDLRRTCGRQMDRAGISIEDIANIFVHRYT